LIQHSSILPEPPVGVISPPDRILHISPLGAPVARVVVDVSLKPEILDPQGRAVQGALGRLGLAGVTSVRQGKQFVIEIDGAVDEAKLHELAANLLSNPVIENYTLRVEA
jgi:phosphoribosylformylglycinamidine synthase